MGIYTFYLSEDLLYLSSTLLTKLLFPVTTARAPHKRKIKAVDAAPHVGRDVGVDNNWLFAGALDGEDDSEFDESDVENF